MSMHSLTRLMKATVYIFYVYSWTPNRLNFDCWLVNLLWLCQNHSSLLNPVYWDSRKRNIIFKLSYISISFHKKISLHIVIIIQYLNYNIYKLILSTQLFCIYFTRFYAFILFFNKLDNIFNFLIGYECTFYPNGFWFTNRII